MQSVKKYSTIKKCREESAFKSTIADNCRSENGQKMSPISGARVWLMSSLYKDTNIR